MEDDRKTKTHNDVEMAGAKAIGIGYEAGAESGVRRKLDRNMIPLFFVLCKCMIGLFPSDGYRRNAHSSYQSCARSTL